MGFRVSGSGFGVGGLGEAGVRFGLHGSSQGFIQISPDLVVEELVNGSIIEMMGNYGDVLTDA